MHRGNISSRVVPKIKWVNPKDRIKQWNIVTGDKVAIIAGKDKDTIGEIKSVNRKTNTVIVEGKKLAKKHVPMQPAAPEGIMRIELPIHYSNVMLLHPNTQTPTRIERRKVTRTLEDGRIISRWSRFVKGTDIEIPKPQRKYDDQSVDEQFTTAPEDVLTVTYQHNPFQPPFPQDLVKELRNPYKKKLNINLNATTTAKTTEQVSSQATI
ncbi:translation protein SH3-like domain-containing protein [Cokeromyces recurvatus]|uniref:translation protein SH3-like domain-containing protein n=1 Tax=Cokeromyces recurvatus TaxID=90255 RepID=UPI0022212116|nr:translation protein SH3-like domain-containing protein [Cokeromyces recurvatus]KAI7899306.1 translation protein SH3-like domain-containing protein [Cokeromyces recurvatus]